MTQRRCWCCGLWFTDLKAHVLATVDDHVSRSPDREPAEHEHIDLRDLPFNNNAYSAARYVGEEKYCTACNPIIQAEYSKKATRGK